MSCKYELVSVLKGHVGRVWHVAWNPSGDTLVTCGADRVVRLWSRDQQWQCHAVLSDGHTRTIRSASFSPCGRFLATASFDATVAVWDSKSGWDCVATLEGHESEVKSVGWAKSGHYLASASRDKSVWLWELTDEEELEFECAAVLMSHSQDVKRIRWSPVEDVLASASYDDTSRIYVDDGDEWVGDGLLQGHTSTVWSLAWDAVGKRLATCSADGTVRIWRKYPAGSVQAGNSPSWLCICTLSGYHTRAIYDVDWCQKTGALATACGDNKVRIFVEEPNSNAADAPTFSLVLTIDAHDEDVNGIAWNPTVPGLLTSCSDDETVKLWQITL